MKSLRLVAALAVVLWTTPVVADDPCVPDCTGKVCGDDGCGGSCGACPGAQDVCTAGQCVCQPLCTGKVCGDDGCGGSCGECAANQQCVGGQCVCAPECTGKLCGDDGCGGSCGECAANQQCVGGQCVCAPDCTGKLCGDDGCGGSCGECAAGQYCDGSQQCVPYPACQVGPALKCNDVVQLDTTTGTAGIPKWSCWEGDESGPELVFGFDTQIEDAVTFALSGLTGDLDLLFLEGSCAWDKCVAYGDSQVSAGVVPGQHYYLVVDGKDGAAGPFTLTVTCELYCEPDCTDKTCGDDGCGGSCGPCNGGTCTNGICYVGPGCVTGQGPTCGGCPCQSCVCEMDPYCCNNFWDGLCVSECINECGACPTLKNCGDGICQADEFETCGTCAGDCVCAAGQTCLNGACCAAQCEGKECGDDGCGGSCGECVGGLICTAGQCESNDGCTATAVPMCPGCACEECVCAMDSYCCATAWDGLCVDECQNDCGGCGSALPNCGDGDCKASEGEDCKTCKKDCGCAAGYMCSNGECVESTGPEQCLGLYEPSGPDRMNISYEGCCDVLGRVLWCDGGQLYCIDCTQNPDTQCGWKATEGFYDCGTDGSPEPTGTFPMECPGSCSPPCGAGQKCVEGKCVACEPQCAGKNCGKDGCGGECGICPAGQACLDGLCTTAGCEVLDGVGCGGCPCEECVCAMDAFCCSTQWDDICVGECVDQCGGCPEPEPYCGDKLCNNGEDCGSCAVDCPCAPGQSCIAGVCTSCVAKCDGKECGADGCGGSCGECAVDQICSADGQCECAPECTGKECGSDGCSGECGQCADYETCTADGQCVCTPDCTGKECGDNGCGGTCGGCGIGGVCNAEGQCKLAEPEAEDVAEEDVPAKDVPAEDGVPDVKADGTGTGDMTGKPDGSGWVVDDDTGSKSSSCAVGGSGGPGAGVVLLVLLALGGLYCGSRRTASLRVS